ncbi:hypothetical protein CRG98_035532 [Punica granatum]|uniref:Uncharacterized protein n=1 Tax=Punica granatum TaxID=22663 RepID=A0A2I0IK38_PUNGR|nr:hypothetical protein CRG98_035532 [Punica granatum]
MPTQGAHLMYGMGFGVALTALSKGRFSPHHTLLTPSIPSLAPTWRPSPSSSWSFGKTIIKVFPLARKLVARVEARSLPGCSKMGRRIGAK